MGDINDRIIKLIRDSGKSQNGFAESLNTSGSRISNIVRKRNKPDADLLADILRTYTNVNPRWLILGDGNMYLNNSPTSADIISQSIKYRKKEDTGSFAEPCQDYKSWDTLALENQQLRIENERLKTKVEALLEAFAKIGK
ncbi:helix-turn-helix transcriptional regulator [Cytophagaceae bacterium ABcell3]|nr:helix-turn-helix transcriptional regulator [Cytophagaceae bacterium ABcell3]